MRLHPLVVNMIKLLMDGRNYVAQSRKQITSAQNKYFPIDLLRGGIMYSLFDWPNYYSRKIFNSITTTSSFRVFRKSSLFFPSCDETFIFSHILHVNILLSFYILTDKSLGKLLFVYLHLVHIRLLRLKIGSFDI